MCVCSGEDVHCARSGLERPAGVLKRGSELDPKSREPWYNFKKCDIVRHKKITLETG